METFKAIIKSMKRSLFIFPVLFIFLYGCKKVPDYYKNLYTGQLYTKEEMVSFSPVELAEYINNRYSEMPDTLKESFTIRLLMQEIERCGDTVIQPFKYDLMIDNEYIVRARNYEKIGMKPEIKYFPTVSGDTVRIGGEQPMPILINLWFVNCRGCIEEIPALNRLCEKYTGKVNFVAMTFENEKVVTNFLTKREFNFTQITNVPTNYIKHIGTYPYPENIFLDKNGYIKYIEGPLSFREDLDAEISYFESLLNKLLDEDIE